MALLEAINISHSFGDKILYQDASLELFKGEHMGLVGQNGTGKTTLLNSFIGDILPDKGEIRRQNGINVGYLNQLAVIGEDVTVMEYLKTSFAALYETEANLQKLYEALAKENSDELLRRIAKHQHTLEVGGFYEAESEILKVSNGLGITAFGMDTPLARLSGGQRARVILAKLLIESPDVLLLDEPTNFLDREHVEWLTGYLKAFSGAFIVISHDFAFLDGISTAICEIEFCRIKKYSAGFSKYIELKGENRENYIREYEAQKRHIKKMEEYIAKNKSRAATARIARGRQKQLDRIDRIAEPQLLSKPRFNFESLPILPGRKALTAKALVIGYEFPLLPAMDFEILSGEKIVITGFNGIGKTTLLKTLTSRTQPISGAFALADDAKIAYYEQGLRWANAEDTPLGIVSAIFPGLAEREVRGRLAQCAIKAKSVRQPISTLSGGEQAKVKLCALMMTASNLLFLDEPTNHIDSDAKEALREELMRWSGTIVLVSHEAAFYTGWADRVINIETLLE